MESVQIRPSSERYGVHSLAVCDSKRTTSRRRSKLRLNIPTTSIVITYMSLFSGVGKDHIR